MNSLLISVIIPIFNMDKYLNDCLDSIQHQNYNNIEVILVDDGSNDCSRKICQNYVNVDSRYRLYCKENEGVSSARNLGLSHAKGDWIMFVDPDDLVKSDLIERLVAEIDEKTDIICCCCRVLTKKEMIDDHFFDGNRLFSTNEEKQTLWGQLLDLGYEHPLPRYTAIGVPWGKIYRRKLFDKWHLQFDTTLVRMQDNVFNTYAFYYANSIKYLDEPLYVYRYDNILNYLKVNADRICSIYSSLQVAREKAFTELGLFTSEFLTKKYYEEAVYNLVVTCKKGIFIPRNSILRQKRLFSKFINLQCYKTIILHYKHSEYSHRDMYYQCIVHRQFLILYIWGLYRAIFKK